MSFKNWARPVARRVAHVFEPPWAALIGSLYHDSVPAWSSALNEGVLVLAPHPDDETIGSAGAILGHVAAGDRVSIVIATDGRRSRAVSGADEMARVRHEEAQHAFELLGAHRFEWLGLPEGSWPVGELAELLYALLVEIRPRIIYAPSRVDFHPEHLKVAHALALSLDRLNASMSATRVRAYQVQVPLTSHLVNLVLDTTDMQPRWSAALRAYASQSASVECAFRHRAYAARAHGRSGSAEEFWELSAASYAQLHREPPSRWKRAFRGLRYWPFSDPLAYLVGNRERRRIRDATALH